MECLATAKLPHSELELLHHITRGLLSKIHRRPTSMDHWILTYTLVLVKRTNLYVKYMDATLDC